MTNIGEGGKEATGGGRRDLRGVDRSNHEAIAHANAGDETAEH